MDRPHRRTLAIAVAAIAIGFAMCTSAAAPRERVAELTAQGDASFKAAQYASAETAYREALQLAVQGDGDPEQLIAPLTGLGMTFARTGHHADAIPLLQRAVAITRAQSGIFDLRQQNALKTLADSLTALNRQPEAQDAMIYRVRIAEKTYGEGSPKVIPLLCDLGNWFAEIGKTPEARMSFQTALNIVGTTDSLESPIIVEPLRGIARAYMLRTSYPDAWRRDPYPALGCSMPHAVTPPECLNARMDPSGRLFVEPRTLNPEGEEALQRALRIVESDPDSAAQTRIETLLQMGDWYQIKKEPREALTYYERAWQLIRATPRLPDSAAAALNAPLRLYYPTPTIVANVPTMVAAVDTQSYYVQTEFTVAPDGTVRDARIVGHDTRDRYAQDILKAVRDSLFRPKFVDGHAVAATGITYREVFWTGKPRE